MAGFFDSIGSAFDSVLSPVKSTGNWLSGNSSWLGPLAIVGGAVNSYFSNKDQIKAQNKYAKQQAKQSYLDTLSLRDWYQQYLDYSKEAEEEGAAGLEEAMAQQEAMMAMIQEMYAPYMEAGKRMLPYAEKLGKTGYEGLGNLYSQISSPESMSLLNNLQNIPKDLTTSQVGLPSYLKR